MSEKKYIPHIYKEGARFHVISYIGVVGNGQHRCIERCSEPNCIVNKEYDKTFGDKHGKNERVFQTD